MSEIPSSVRSDAADLFLSARGRSVVDGRGREVVLRGVGLGGWLLPEGYMWRLPAPVDRPRRIEAMISALVGTEEAARFWQTYRERYIDEGDIERIADEGFNSVRVPLNARLLLAEDDAFTLQEEGFRLVDKVIASCRVRGLYVILDLHGAPGGQTGTNIDDSNADRPELFTDERNAQRAIALWRVIARRYRDEWCVAGYDLLNEPLPRWFHAYNDRVMPLYRRMVAAIREVDSRHMVILEGVHWATDWSIFTHQIDANAMLQFHKYWDNPDNESIAPYLAKRQELDLPIMMGEGGENNKEWYAGAFRLFEEHSISWNFWTWKKMDCDNSPCSVRMPKTWSALQSHAEQGAPMDRSLARDILGEYLDNIPFDQCDYHPEVVNALFRRPPVRVPAVFYGYRGEGKSFGISRHEQGDVGFRRGEGTAIQFAQGPRTTATFEHGDGRAWSDEEWLTVQLSATDWLSYEFCSARSGATFPLRIELRARAPQGRGVVTLVLDGEEEKREEISRREWSSYGSTWHGRTDSTTHILRVTAREGPVLIQWIDLTRP